MPRVLPSPYLFCHTKFTPVTFSHRKTPTPQHVALLPWHFKSPVSRIFCMYPNWFSVYSQTDLEESSKLKRKCS